MNKSADYDFTVLVPIYNEEENIPKLERELAKFLRTTALKSCILFINDGSNDKSEKLIKEICTRQPAMYYLSLDRNGGLSAALKAGIDATDSRYVGYMDADLQTSPEDFNFLLEYITEYPLVVGIRMGRKDNLIKKVSSRIANKFRRMMTHDGIEDTGCPLKVMWTDYAKRIPFFTGMHRFLPALILLQKGGKVKQLPVRHYPRTAGISKYHLWNRLTGPFKDCFAYRWMKKRYINYEIKSSDL
ncbi:glycosyltransferase [Parabacteroides pacaensis]|uniref:glycosyltransferase n=1 Tax=Parabacteroides pacaensis TaxID=2086575 RepID=UPI000D0E4357|nr:glycosyltransferase [Parabacteroides pacaensis]